MNKKNIPISSELVNRLKSALALRNEKINEVVTQLIENYLAKIEDKK